MRQFLDRLPLAIQAKAEPGARAVRRRATRPARRRAAPRVAQLLDATLHHRRVTMRYHSFSSNREKSYTRRAAAARLRAGRARTSSPSCRSTSELRTFSVDRILSLSVTDERFEPQELSEDAFAHSLGVHQGTPERIEIAFEPRMARYVKERVWHAVAADRASGLTAAWS